MQERTSITTAINKLLVSISLTITLIYSLLILTYSWVIEDNIFNRQVLSEAKYIQEQFAKTQQLTSPRTSYMSLHNDWEGLPKEFKQEYLQKPDKIEFSSPVLGTVHIQVLSLGKEVYVLAANVDAYEVSRDYLPTTLVWLLVLSIICCSLVAIYGLYKARKLINPLNRLANQVSSKDEINQVEVDDNYPNNEIGILAEKIKETFSRLTDAWEREAHFTKDVSHEIRTPVAIAKNILAQPFTKTTEQEWRQLTEANMRLEQITNTLLALARNESTNSETTNVTALIENCLLTNSDVNHSKKGQSIKFNISAGRDVFLEVNTPLVAILFNNVLSNIVHYTTGDDVSIEITSSSVKFVNSYQHAIPNELFKSGEKGSFSQGIGHGLNLIERIAHVYEWQVRVDTSSQAFSLSINFDDKGD